MGETDTGQWLDRAVRPQPVSRVESQRWLPRLQGRNLPKQVH